MNSEKKVMTIQVEVVKIIGKMKGIKGKIELIMDRDTFLEWNNLRNCIIKRGRKNDK